MAADPPAAFPLPATGEGEPGARLGAGVLPNAAAGRTPRRAAKRAQATWLPIPRPGRWAAEEYVARHLGHLVERRGTSSVSASPWHRGGQTAADAALCRFRVEGYARRADAAYPQPRRAVSGLSPWIRHGLLSLQRVWDSVDGGPPEDVRAFRAAIARQEYARHLYARLGRHLVDVIPAPPGSEPTRPGGRRQSDASSPVGHPGGADDACSDARAGWDRRLGCVEVPIEELEEDGWVVAEGRRWLAAHGLTQGSDDWRHGEEHGHRYALDGSRAAGRMAWLEAAGALGTSRPLTTTRWDVEERAPGLCASCELVYACPIERPHEQPPAHAIEVPAPTAMAAALLEADPDLAATAGPAAPVRRGEPDVVWLTAESLGDADPALVAHPELPVVFVFDEPLLARLRLSGPRLCFFVETLADLAERRRIDLWLGEPEQVLAERRPAVTFTPVPGWKRLAARLHLGPVTHASGFTPRSIHESTHSTVGWPQFRETIV